MLDVLIADDHRVVRQGLKQLLEDSADIGYIHEAENGAELLKRIHTHDYHIILLDISMPGKSGLALLKEIKQIKPEVSVLMVSIYPEELYALSALRAGASGYVNKIHAPDELIPAIRAVTQGGTYFSDSLIRITQS